MTTAYLVTDGDYSDYRVMGVYTTKDKARHAAKLFGVANNRIEEYELDAVPDAPPGMFRWQVDMDRDGNVAKARRVTSEVLSPNVDWHPGLGCETWTRGELPTGIGPCIAAFMWAKDKKHAIKVANELRTRLIAAGDWTTNWDAWVAYRRALGLRA